MDSWWANKRLLTEDDLARTMCSLPAELIVIPSPVGNQSPLAGDTIIVVEQLTGIDRYAKDDLVGRDELARGPYLIQIECIAWLERRVIKTEDRASRKLVD